VASKGVLDVRGATPKSDVELKANGVQVGPFLRDALKNDLLEGTMQADVALRMAGDEPEGIKRTLNGKGELLLTDGAIKGFDLAGMVRNVGAAFGLAEKSTERPKTDFSELRVPFTITNGLANTPETSMMSPLLRVRAAGKADLVKETLDMRVEPKFVGTLKGQGDTMERSGVMVPVLVSGTFSAPTFRPDLKGMIKMGLKEELPKPADLKKVLPTKELPKPGDLKKLIPGVEEKGKTKKKKADAAPLEEKAKDLLKNLPRKQ
jgi:AsmA protein